jgi:hypothetical protein
MLTAKYPVRLDPTFGCTSVGASSGTQWNDSQPRGSLYNTHEAGSDETITNIYIHAKKSSATDTNMQVSAYSIDTYLDVRLGTTKKIAVTNTDLAWLSVSMSDSMSSGVTYGLGFGCYGEAGSVTRSYDSGSGDNYTIHNTSEALPENWTSLSTGTAIYSIYATYTESGGGSALPQIVHHMKQQGIM